MKYINIKKFQNNKIISIDDPVVEEQAIEIYINRNIYISLMCLPQDILELAVGFLFSEGIIHSYSDIDNINIVDDVNVYVTTNEFSTSNVDNRIKTTGFAASSVSRSLYSKNKLVVMESKRSVDASTVKEISKSFNKKSQLFLDTGAVHSCELILPNGDSIFYDDIGRHNAIDKIIGKALISKLSVKDSLLMTSGRISSEMLLKVAKMEIPILISTSAPTSLAIEIARELDMTLIGFARGDRFNLYSGNHRVIEDNTL